VNPILPWSYEHVWLFLRGARLGYCGLYDAGFTSLGAPADSAPNPRLRVVALGGDGGDDGGADAEPGATRLLPLARVATAVRALLPLGAADARAAWLSHAAAVDATVSVARHADGCWYAPAWLLADGAAERLGRASKPRPAPAPGPTPVPAPGPAPVCEAARPLRVAVLLVGGELLDGAARDEGGPALCRALREAGAAVERVVAAPGEAVAVARSVQWCLQDADAVVSVGGVGSPHAEAVWDGVAAAVGAPREPLPELASALRRCFARDGGRVDADVEARARAGALVPRGARVHVDVDAADGVAPLVSVGPVAVVPSAVPVHVPVLVALLQAWAAAAGAGLVGLVGPPERGRVAAEAARGGPAPA
jgi:hypothetical protein